MMDVRADLNGFDGLKAVLLNVLRSWEARWGLGDREVPERHGAVDNLECQASYRKF